MLFIKKISHKKGAFMNNTAKNIAKLSNQISKEDAARTLECFSTAIDFMSADSVQEVAVLFADLKESKRSPAEKNFKIELLLTNLTGKSLEFDDKNDKEQTTFAPRQVRYVGHSQTPVFKHHYAVYPTEMCCRSLNTYNYLKNTFIKTLNILESVDNNEINKLLEPYDTKRMRRAQNNANGANFIIFLATFTHQLPQMKTVGNEKHYVNGLLDENQLVIVKHKIASHTASQPQSTQHSQERDQRS